MENFKETDCERWRWDRVQQRASVLAAPNTSTDTTVFVPQLLGTELPELLNMPSFFASWIFRNPK
jgi:hypothetical protein